MWLGVFLLGMWAGVFLLWVVIGVFGACHPAP